MKVQRLPALMANERTANGLQLTRVVPPSFSVPFSGGVRLGFFFVKIIRFPIYLSVGQGSRQNKKKGEEKHGKGKIGKKYHTS